MTQLTCGSCGEAGQHVVEEARRRRSPLEALRRVDQGLEQFYTCARCGHRRQSYPMVMPSFR